MFKSIENFVANPVYCIRQVVLRVGFKFQLATGRVKVPAPSRLLLLLLASCGVAVQAAPTGGQVVSGNVQIQAPAGNTLNILQTSDKGIINWGSFSIATGERVNFQQPGASSVTLNRVIGNDLSQIYGTLSANGQVFLVNPNGVLFAPGAQVNVGGLVASTLDLSNENFLAGAYKLSGTGNGLGVVSNAGVIHAGYVVLAGVQVSNTGSIVTPGGTTALVAGERVSLGLTGSELLSVSVDAAAVGAQVRAGGVIQADGGQVVIGARSANALLDTVLNVDGVVRAQSLAERNGRIVLDGGPAGVVAVTGTLDASGLGAGQTGGAVSVLGDKVGLFSGALIDVRGTAGGGVALVGGNWQGQGPQRNASDTFVSSGSRIEASAVAFGNGGKVVVWADGRTQMDGSITARGGDMSGQGGQVETSGKAQLGLSGNVDVSGVGGGGLWLMDPNDISITNVDARLALSGPAVFQNDASAFDAKVDTTSIKAALVDGATVTVQTSNTGTSGGTGKITVDGAIDASTTAGQTATLKLIANGAIEVNQKIAPTAGKLNVGLFAGSNATPASEATAGAQAGAVTVAAPITTGGGAFTAVAQGITLNKAVSTGVGAISITSKNNAAITQAAAADAGLVTTTGTVSIDAGTVAVNLVSTGNSIGGAISSVGSGAVTIVNAADTVLGVLGATGAGRVASLDVTATGKAVSQTGAAFVAGTTTVKAGSGTVTLNNAGNELTGVISSTGTGAVTLVNTLATQLGTLGATGAGSLASLDVTATGKAVSQTGAAFVVGTTIVKAGSGTVTLNNAGNELTGAVSSTGAGALTLVNTLDTKLSTLGATGAGSLVSLDVTATGKAVSQTGAAFVAGTTTVKAGSGTVTLNNAGNQLGGAISSTGTGAVVLVNTLDTQLGAIGAAGAGRVATLDITATGKAVTQSAPVFVNGATTISAVGGNVTLGNTGNDFAGKVTITGNAITLVDGVGDLDASGVAPSKDNSLDLQALAGTLTGPSGALDLGTGSLTLTSSTGLTVPTGANYIAKDIALSGGTGALTIKADIDATGTLALTGASVAQDAGTTIKATGTTQVDAGAAGAITLDQATNDFGAAVTLKGGVTAVSDANKLTLGTLTTGNLTVVSTGALNLGAGKVAGTLNASSNGGDITQTGALTVTGVATVDAAAGSIVLANAGNDFGAQVTAKSSGNAGTSIDIRSANDLTTSITQSGTNQSLSLVAGKALTPGLAAIDTGTGDLTLAAGSGLTTGGALKGNNVSLDGGTTLSIGHDVTSAGTLTLKGSTSIAQTAGALTVGTTTSVTGGSVALNGANNDFTGAVSVSGSTVSVTDKSGLVLGDVNTTGTLTASATAGDITQAALKTVVAGGNATFNAAAGKVTLGNTGNDFKGSVSGSAGSDMTLVDQNALSVGSVGATGVLTLTSTGQLELGQITNASSLVATSNGGDIVQSNAANVTGTTQLSAGAGNVTVKNGANNLQGAVSVTAAVADLRQGTGNPLTLGTLAVSGNFTVESNGGALNLGQGSVGGNLSAITHDNPITQTGALLVTGATTVQTNPTGLLGNVTLGNAGNKFTGAINVNTKGDLVLVNSVDTVIAGIGAPVNSLVLTATGKSVTQTGAVSVANAANLTAGTVTLDNAGNDFQGAVTATSTVGGISLRDTNALNATATPAANQSLSLVAGTTLNIPAGAIDTGTGDLTLKAGTGITTTGTLKGNKVSLDGGTTLAIGDSITSSGTLALAGSTSITQNSGTITAGGVTTLTGGSIDLNQAGNDFKTTVSATGSSLAINDGSGGLVLGTVTLSGDLTATSASTLGLGTGSVGGKLVATANGAVSQTGALLVTGTSKIDAGAGTITLADAGNDFTGLVTVSSTGGSISLQDKNALNVLATPGSNQSLSLVAGTTLTLPVSDIDTGAGDLTLSAGGGLTTVGKLSGNKVSLDGGSALGLGNDVTSTGAMVLKGSTSITQTAGTITAGGTATLTGGSIDVSKSGNDFKGAVTATGSTVKIADANALALASVTAAGDLTGSAVTGLTTTGAVSGANVSLDGGTTLGIGANLTSTGTLVLKGSTSITQTAGAITAGTTTTLTGGSVDVGLATNDFKGAVAATGSSIKIGDSNALVLGAVSTAGSLTVNSNGALTQTAPLTVGTTTVITSGGGAITLNDAGNDFGGQVTATSTGGAISLTDKNDLSAIASPGASQSLSLVAGGTLTIPPGAIDTGTGDLTLKAGTGIATTGALKGNNVSLDGGTTLAIGDSITSAGSLTLKGSTSINQTAGTIKAGSTSSITGGTVNLAQAGNDFVGTVSASGSSIKLTDANALTLASSNTTGGDLTLVSTGALSLGAGTVNGGLNATSNGGNVVQTGAIVVTGNSVVDAGAGKVTLTNVANDFQGTVTVSGNGIEVVSSNNLDAASVKATSGADLNLQALAGTLKVAGGAIDIGSGNLTLVSGTGLDTTGAPLTANNVSLGGGSGALTLGDSVKAGGTLTLAGASVNQTAGGITSGAATVNAGSGAVTLTSASNDFTGAVTITGGTTQITDANALTLGALKTGDLTAKSSGLLDLGSNTINGTLTATSNGGDIVQSGPIVVTGTSTLNAGAGAIQLGNAGNDFQAAVAATGGAVTLADKNALDLGATTAASLVVSTSNGALTQSGPLVVAGTTQVNTGTAAITLTNAGNDFTGALSLTGGATKVVDKNALTLGTLATGDLTLTSTGALNLGQGTVGGALVAGANTIAQTGALTVTGTSNLTAPLGTVSLADAGNDFQGKVTITGTANIVDKNDLDVSVSGIAAHNIQAGGNLVAAIAGGPASFTLKSGANLAVSGFADSVTTTSGGTTTLGALNVNAPIGTLNLTSGGAVTQTGAVSVAATTTISAAGQAVTLDNAGNDFGGAVTVTGAATKLTDKNALTLNAVNASSLDLVAAGAVGQTGVLTVTGATSVNAGTGTITLADANNDFGGVVSLTGGATKVADKNTLTLGTLATGDLTATSAGALDLGQGTVGGNLLASSGGLGAIVQAGPLTVTGSSDLNAGGFGVLLANAGNDFQGTVKVVGIGVQLADKNTIDLGAASVNLLEVTTANGAITQSGALVVAVDTKLNAGTGDITLSNAGNDFNGPVALTGAAVKVADLSAIELGAVKATSLEVSAGGAITQSAAAAVTGTTTVNAGANAVTLSNAANDFGAAVAVTGGAVKLTDANALVLGAISATSLDVKAGGDVSQTGAAKVSGAGSVDAGSGAITLGNAANDFGGTLTLTGGATQVTDASALDVKLATGVTTIAAGGALTVSGTAASLATQAAATSFGVTTVAGALNTQAGGAVSQTGTLSTGASSSIDAGTNIVTLTNAGNQFAGTTTVVGGTTQVTAAGDLKVALTTDVTAVNATGALDLSGNVKSLSATAGGALNFGALQAATSLTANAGGPVTQSGGVKTGDSSAVLAGSNAITLDNAGNDFSGTLSLVGGATQVADANALVVNLATGATTLNAGGALTVAGKAASLSTTGGDTSFGATTVAGALNAVSSGAITQSGALVTGASSKLDAGAGSIALNGAGNSLAGTTTLVGGITQLNVDGDLNAVLSTGSTTLSAGGALAVSGTAASLATKAAATEFGTTTVVGALDAVAAGAVTQSGALKTGADSSVNAGANAITLDNIGNDFSGTLTLTGAATKVADANALAVAGNVASLDTTAGATSFGATTMAGALKAVATGAVSQTGTLQTGASSSISAGANAITLADSANQFAGTLTLAGGATSVASGSALKVDLNTGATTLDTTGTLAVTGTASSLVTNAGATDFGATTVSGALQATAAGAVTQSGAIQAGAGSSIDAGKNAITLADPGNVFGGALSLAGGATQVTSPGALNLVLNTGATQLTATGALNVAGQADSLTTQAAATSFGATTVAGPLAVTATGAVTQTGALKTGAASNISAGANAVTLANAGNDFVGTLTVNAGATQLVDANTLAVVLNASGAATLDAGGALQLAGKANTLTAKAGGAVTQTAALDITGATSVNAGANAVTLDNAANNFGGAVSVTGGAVQVKDSNALDITLDTAAATVSTTGDLAVAGKAGSLNATATQGVSFGATAVTGTLGVSGTSLAQTGALSVGGASTVNVGSGTVTLTQAGNDFGGPVSLTAGATQITDANALSLGTLSIGALTATSQGDLNLGAGTVTGNLQANSGNGGIAQSGPLTVTGTTDLKSGTGDIALGNTGNDLQGVVSASGGAVALATSNKLSVSTVSARGGLSLTGASIAGVGASALGVNQFSLTASGPITLVATSGGIGNVGTEASGLFTNVDILSLNPANSGGMTLSFADGSIANFAVDSQSQFRTAGIVLSNQNEAKKADVWGCFGTGICVNLDSTGLFLANAAASATIAAATQEALLRAFGTDNLTAAIQRAFITKIGVVPPGIDEIEGDLGSTPCEPKASGSGIQTAPACNK